MLLSNDFSKQTEISRYIGKLLRESFGKGPEAIYLSVGYTFITIYLKAFMSPMETVLLANHNEDIIFQSRTELLKSLLPEIKSCIKFISGIDITEFYYDWGLHNKSGIIVGIFRDPVNTEEHNFEEYEGKESFHNEILALSKEVQKKPTSLTSYSLNPRTLIVLREGILVSIEKELIKMGHSKTLKLAKNKLEKTYLHNNTHYESLLNKKVVDIFIDWNFESDKSVIVFIMDPTNK